MWKPKELFHLLATDIFFLKCAVVWQTTLWMCNLFFISIFNWKLTKLIKVLFTSVNIQLKMFLVFVSTVCWITFFSTFDLYKLILQLHWSLANSETLIKVKLCWLFHCLTYLKILISVCGIPRIPRSRGIEHFQSRKYRD